MYYNGPGFILSYDLAVTPTLTPLVSLTGNDAQEDWKRVTTCWLKRGGGKSKDGVKAQSSINKNESSFFSSFFEYKIIQLVCLVSLYRARLPYSVCLNIAKVPVLFISLMISLVITQWSIFDIGRYIQPWGHST